MKNGIEVHCRFSGNTPGAICVQISFNGPLNNPLVYEEVTNLLQRNSAGKSWSPPITENGPFGKIITWKRSDGAIATYQLQLLNINSARLMK